MGVDRPQWIASTIAGGCLRGVGGSWRGDGWELARMGWDLARMGWDVGEVFREYATITLVRKIWTGWDVGVVFREYATITLVYTYMCICKKNTFFYVKYLHISNIFRNFAPDFNSGVRNT